MAGYTIEPKNKFLSTVCALVEYENRPGNTVTFNSQVDLSDVERLRAGISRGSPKPSYTAILMKAIAMALREHPYANRRVWRLPFGIRRLQSFAGIDATVLCERDIPGAPMVAFCDVFRNADRASLSEINRWLRDLATCDETTNKQWREFKTVVGKLPCWMSRIIVRLPLLFPGLWVKYRGGAFAISSPAKYGVDDVQAMWPWPLGFSFGLVKPRPVVVDGALEIRPTFTLTMNFDRRVMAGAQAARFFHRIVSILEHAMTEMASCLPEENRVAERESVFETAEVHYSISRMDKPLILSLSKDEQRSS
ncbi:MAG: 2-oxo acid dehydrogenase subunit E2 [Planctomycetota bacterium]